MSTTPSSPPSPLTPGDPKREPVEAAPAGHDHRDAQQFDVPPKSGSADSWTDGPHPVATGQPVASVGRVAVMSLVGLVLLTVGFYAGYQLLASRSPNGNGTAAWTGDVKNSNGAVILGINDQQGAAPAVTASAVPRADPAALQAATASCEASIGNAATLSQTTGTVASVGNWAIQATPLMNEFRSEAAALENDVATSNAAAIPDAATKFCGSLAKVGALPAVPDAAGAQDWRAALAAYASGAILVLKGAGGDTTSLGLAATDFTTGSAKLDALAARITSAT